jgi:replicative DNA helicase
LKESGGIEAHADVVIFVHREEQYDKTKRVGEADLIVAKNRGGPLGDVQVAAQLHLNRFMSMALPERTN